ncbi:Paraquat-inducible protein A [Caenispirillum salinarum AK4]|uniref:Paraquat-inducible protein A n=1 Tax=Caenispirillum salinarum AK4 TaxID=1238182 RepID=K9HR99_9PROT|nr:paraquat-inducible protein A [Caenispirillum salinarum]EKV32808.1 Paraquat-inducible protein A [Caenispirillum salinarum AK4]
MTRALLTPILAGTALVLLGLGIGLPLLHIDRLWLFTDSVSLWQAIVTLYSEGEPFLAVVLTAFSIVFPVLKLIGVLWAWRRPSPRMAAVVDGLGKWSMMDVLVVALLIVTLKGSGLVNAASAPGVYCFAAAVLLSMIAGMLAKKDPST